MDFQDLLDEVEGAMQTNSSLKKVSVASSSRQSSYSESSRVTAARTTTKQVSGLVYDE